ncbi:hypothetical protein [Yinghuangia seranimata]|uniref:hypothetical protein n=1 Tax=Yinghuangia seranimata TaxID=408067 RepID=UPI00248C0AF5|nr:hypothetical protein [Yinghuangia seranimata]MDI2129147.1 hypothetical protein [Yinghuangia seranimata]
MKITKVWFLTLAAAAAVLSAAAPATATFHSIDVSHHDGYSTVGCFGTEEGDESFGLRLR